jgi:hypothetical protein
MGCTPIQRHIAGWDPTVRNRSAGAAIAAQGAARPGGYRYYHNGCYRQRPDGAWLIVAPEYCAPPPEPIADDYDGGDYGDYAMAREYLAPHFDPLQAAIELARCRAAAERLVRSAWAQQRIRLLADALLHCGTLSGEEIHRI